MKNFKQSLVKMALVAAAAGMGTMNAAHADVIDFESAATSGCQVTAGGTTDGFTLSPYNGTIGGGFNNSSDCSFLRPTAHSGTQFMVNFNSVTSVFTKDVGTFSLNSLWVAADSRVGNTTVRFQGLDGVGSTLYSEDVQITTDWQQVNFSGWDNVKSFTWNSLAPDVTNISIDDFAFNGRAVPEPATMLLMGLGLTGLALSRRQRKH